MNFTSKDNISSSTLNLQSWAIAAAVACLDIGFRVSRFDPELEPSFQLVLLLWFQLMVLSFALRYLIDAWLKPVKQQYWIHLSIVVSGLLLYWTPMGFDITDEGRRLAFSYFFHDNLSYHIKDFKLGSHLVYWIWLNVFEPSLIWARIGFVILKVASAILLYRILCNYGSKKLAFIGTVFGAIIAMVFAGQTINYNNLPTFFVLLSLFSIEQSLERKKKVLWLILGGSSAAFAVLSKFTLVTYLPIFLMWAAYRSKHALNSGYIKAAFVALLGMVGVMCLHWLVLGSFGLFEEYFQKIQRTIIEPFIMNATSEDLARQRHDPAYLKEKYVSDAWLILYEGWKYLIALIISIAACHLKNTWVRFGVWILAAYSVYWLLPQTSFDIALLGLCFSIGLIALFYSIRSKEEFSLVALAIAASVVLFIGSNNGLKNILISGGISMVFAAAYVILSQKHRYYSISITSIAAATALFVWLTKSEQIYRDAPAHKLTEAFQSEGLKFIYSTPKRVKTVDDFLSKASAVYDGSSTLLAANGTPMFNYLLKAPLGHQLFWKLSRWDLETKNAFFNSDLGQKYILYSSFDSRRKDWPNMKRPAAIKADLPSLSYYTSLALNPSVSYEIATETEHFVLLVKK